MANTIDNRVVEMRFENQKFEQNVATTIGSMGKLSQALQLNNAANGFGNITAAAQKVDISSISAGIANVNASMIAMESVIATIFRNITTGAMNAGASLAKSLAIDPIQMGFGEYELTMNNMKVMMSSTGESADVVTGALGQLNEYADRTIYSFSDMTANIGKFTNAGVKLQPAVDAIKGVANVAAISGASAADAARAMYNLGQAMSSGSVKLIDWMSVENANMGTKEFKQQLIDTAVAMGTLKKTAKGTYEVITKNGQGGKMKGTITANKNFRDSLSYQWMSTDVLTTTLNKYASTTTDIGKRANAAAADVDTFSKMMTATKESIQSDWALTWQNILGSKEESLKLFTDLGNAITSITAPIGAARNEMLKFWNDEGGRDEVIAGFVNIFSALGDILGPVGKAFAEVFPPLAGWQLVDVSRKFNEFTKTLKPSPALIEGITKIFKGFFSAIKFGQNVVVFFAKAVWTLFDSLFLASGFLPAIAGAFGWVIAEIGGFFTFLNEGIKYSNFFGNAISGLQSVMTSVANAIKGFFSGAAGGVSNSVGQISTETDKVKAKVQAFIDMVSAAVQPIGKVLSAIGQAFKDAFGGISFENVTDVFKLALGGGLLFQLAKFVKGILGFGDKLSGSLNSFVGLGKTFVDKFTGILNGMTGVLSGMQNQLNANALKSIAIAIAILAGAMMLISLIKPERLKGAMVAISLLLVEVMGIMVSFKKLAGDFKGINQAAAALSLIGIALIILSVAVNKLGAMKPEQMAQGLAGIAALLLGLGLFIKFGETDKGLIGAGAGMILFGTALLIMAKAISILGAMDPGSIALAMATIAGLFGFVVAVNKLVKPSEVLTVAFNMIILSGAIAVMSGAIKILGGMSLEQLALGLGSMALGLGIMVVAMRSLPKDSKAKAADLILVAGAVLILGIALKQISSISMDQMIVALLGLALTMAAVIQFLQQVSDPKMLVGAAALVVVAGAMMVLAMVLKILGSMSLEQIGIALLALVGALVVIGLAAYAMTATGAIVAMFALGAALMLIGGAVFLAGAGIGIFAAGIGILAGSLAVGGQVIVDFLVKLSESFPIMAKNLALALGAFALGLVEQQAAITTALIAMFTTVLTALTTIVPQILTFLGNLITGIIALLVTKIPEIVAGLLTLLLALLTTITLYLPLIIAKAGELIVAFINGISANLGAIITAGTNLVINFIRGIGKNALAIATAAMETVVSFIDGLANAIRENSKKFSDAARNLLDALFTAMMAVLGVGVDFVKIGAEIAAGIGRGITGAIDGVIDAGLQLANDVWNGVANFFGIKSPSRLFMYAGKMLVIGLANALTQNTSDAVKAGTSMAEATYSAVAAVTDRALDVFSGVAQPTISPVVDLDAVYAGAKTISSLMSDTAALKASGAINANLAAQSAVGSNTTATDATGNKTEVTFQQNNYSPKSLSRLEIYRQTRNQLQLLKGLGTP